jgi:hypothetical protein
MAASGMAMGQGFSADFEAPAYAGSASGTVLAGQGAWYLPPVVGTEDYHVYTYSGNTFGIPTHPSGGTQFAAATFVSNNARGQHPVDFSAGGEWEAEFDVLATFSAAPNVAINYIGSFSLQDSATSRYFQQLLSWSSNGTAVLGPNGELLNDHTFTGAAFHMALGIHFDTAPITIAFRLPSMQWADLPVDNWYRVKIRWTFDPAAPKILSASLQNLTAGTPAVVTDVSGFNWYLAGGPANTRPLPTDIRIFTGGSTGNVVGWDNIRIQPAATGPTCYANCDNSTTVPFLNVADFGCFLGKFAAGDAYANCDGSTIVPVLNVADFGCFLTKFAAGCSAP